MTKEKDSNLFTTYYILYLFSKVVNFSFKLGWSPHTNYKGNRASITTKGKTDLHVPTCQCRWSSLQGIEKCLNINRQKGCVMFLMIPVK